VYETYRMLGAAHEADLERMARVGEVPAHKRSQPKREHRAPDSRRRFAVLRARFATLLQ
jgi:hypothetical protein